MRASRTTSQRAFPSASSLALLLLGASCGKLGACETKPIVYVDIRDRTTDAPSPAGSLDRAVLEAAISEAMKEWSGYEFRTAKSGEGGWQLNATVEQLTSRVADAPEGGTIDPNKLRRSLGISLELYAMATSARQRFVAEAIEVEVVPAGTSLDALIARTVAKAGEGMKLGLELERKSDEQVMSLLDSPDLATKTRAIAIAGERKIAASREKLEAIARDESLPEELVLRTVGALLAIRDRASAGALIDAAHERSPEIQRQVIYVLGQLGGKEAEAYLFTIESGSEDPALRQAATEALAEIKK